MTPKRKRLCSMFQFSLRDTLITIGILLLASALCALLAMISESDSHVPLIFVLAVFIISLSTSGYAYGLIASIAAVLGVNYIFTYPYFAFNFTMTGYPLTILCSLAVSILTCTMTSRVRQSEKIRLEADREKMRANLLRAISHDFRTPLTSIIGSISVVSENCSTLTDEEIRSFLGEARSDAEWLINMVENLLSITKITADPDASLHKELQAVEEVVGESVAKFRRQYPDVKLEISIPGDMLLIPMDAILIEQVLINLLINSAIHSKTATLTKLTVETDGDHAVFRVDDNGSGIKRDILPGLFVGTVSHHADDTTRSMGIGLTVCNAIVAAHGGSMFAKNLPDGGASVGFTLPLDSSVAIPNTTLEEDIYGEQAEDTGN